MQQNTVFYPAIMRLRHACTSPRLPYLIVFILIAGSLSGCLNLHLKSDITDLNRVYTVKPNQLLQVADTAGHVIYKRLNQRTSALLYVRQDTLFARFSPAALPAADSNPATLDQSDSLVTAFFYHPKTNRWPEQVNPWFHYHLITFDVDLFTVLFKYRFQQPQRAGELLTSTNVGAYMGIRYDRARYRTIQNQFSFRSEIRPLSVGIGGFVSVNSVVVNENNTAGRFTGDYDALGVNYGLASIFGYRSVTAGLAFGFENLADGNNPLWVYRNKLWLGLTIGLNIN